MESLTRVVALIEALAVQRARLTVGVDGPDAAGKTVFANRLADALSLPVIRACLDDFQRPRRERYRRGPLSPEGYYHDSFDQSAMRRHLVEPFLAGADAVRTATFDYRTDSAAGGSPARVSARAVLIVDGVFLLHPAVRGCWALSIYLHVSEGESLRRARIRDAALGDVRQIEQRYRRRYLPAHVRYGAEVAPRSVAHVVIDNEDPGHPSVLRWRPPRGPRDEGP